jgi:toxin ParE1/3/4
MLEVLKRPIVIQDLIVYATYISNDNLDAGDRLLYAAEATFRQIAQFPTVGKLSGFTHPLLTQVRQYPIKGFKSYLILYQIDLNSIDVIRVLHGAQDLQNILIAEIPEYD